jgi:hypothetical protein
VRDLGDADVGIGQHRLGGLDVVIGEFWRAASCATRGNSASLIRKVTDVMVEIEGEADLRRAESARRLLAFVEDAFDELNIYKSAGTLVITGNRRLEA